MSNIAPVLRWAGGKTWFISHFKSIIKDVEINHYHEPFLGGAAIFFSLKTNKMSYLSDENEKLITTYKAIKNSPQEVVRILHSYENSEDRYYEIRDMTPNDDIELAAQFIYLNQTSYNGLYRVNRQGYYNVPYGFRSSVTFDTKRILSVSEKLRKTNLSYGDFVVNKYKIQKGDLVFLDPPYTVSHNNNGFIEYNQKLFSLDDQYRLSDFIDYIKRKNAYYILTNAAHDKIKDIFDKGDRILKFSRQSLIGGKSAERKKVAEYIFTNIE